MTPELLWLKCLLYMAQQIPNNEAAAAKIQALIDALE